MISKIDSYYDSDMTAQQLTMDHKPNNEFERKRIISKGGVVAKSKDKSGKEFGPYRLWNKKMTKPGLSLSRSLGDGFATTLGCSSEAEINKYMIYPTDKILILATDGIFEHLSNQEVAEIVRPHYHIALNGNKDGNNVNWENKKKGIEHIECQEAAYAITDAARERWQLQDPNGIGRIDDCTCTVIFFND